MRSWGAIAALSGSSNVLYVLPAGPRVGSPGREGEEDMAYRGGQEH